MNGFGEKRANWAERAKYVKGAEQDASKTEIVRKRIAGFTDEKGKCECGVKGLRRQSLFWQEDGSGWRKQFRARKTER
jgi:hypothetical protein